MNREFTSYIVLRVNIAEDLTYSKCQINYKNYLFAENSRPDSIVKIQQHKLLSGVSNLWASLGHNGKRRVALGHTVNIQTLMKTDEDKRGFK